MALELHGLLDKTAQEKRTIAVGTYSDGTRGTASSTYYMTKEQQNYAKEHGLKYVKGSGHAEEKLIKDGVKDVEVNRPICSDCEKLIKDCGLSTETLFSGKKSKNRR